MSVSDTYQRVLPRLEFLGTQNYIYNTGQQSDYNAFAHTYMSSRIYFNHGQFVAEVYGFGRELNTVIGHAFNFESLDLLDAQRDTYNNVLGHQIAEFAIASGLPEAALDSLSIDALNRGLLIVNEAADARIGSSPRINSMYDGPSQLVADQIFSLYGVRVSSGSKTGEGARDSGPLPDNVPIPTPRPDGDELFNRCFAAGTLISMADGTQKPIETIQPHDMVLAFDPDFDAGRGALVPSRVVRTFVNQNQTVIDFHGTGVTPGHAFLCGDGPHEGRFRQVMDIIRDDGAVVRDDGSLMRAATGCDVGSAGDAFVDLQLAHPAREKATGREVLLVKDRTRVRAGTRVERPDGTSFSFLELIEENGWALRENGFVGQGEGHEPEPLMWSGRAIPKPEDYILAKSRLTLADLYDDPRELAIPASAPTARRDAPAAGMQAGPHQLSVNGIDEAPVSPSRKLRRKTEAEERRQGRVRKHAGMTVQ